MEIRQRLRQRYNKILQSNEQIKQLATSAPHQISSMLAQRRQIYDNIVNQIVLQIKTTKSFAKEKQKQLQNVINQSKQIAKWAEKRAKTYSQEVQRQRSLNQTYGFLKTTKAKMRDHRSNFEAINKEASIDYMPQTLKSNQYQKLVKDIRQQKKQKNAVIYKDTKPQKEESKNQMEIQKKPKHQSTSLEQRKVIKKQVAFVDYNSEGNLKNRVKLDLRNELLQFQVTGRQGIKSVKNYQFSFKRDKEIFVPKNKNESKQVKQLLQNYNYHKDTNKLQKDLAKLH